MEFNIRFRPLRLEDARFINNLRQMESMEKMIGGSSRPVAYERDVKWVNDLIMNDNQTMVNWAITGLDNDDIIGYTTVTNIDYRNGSCFWGGIKLDPGVAGKGLGQQTALKVLQYCFEELRMVRITSECQEHHVVALNMMLKIGYSKEGLMRKTLFKNGVFNNQWLLSVIDEEYAVIKERFQL